MQKVLTAEQMREVDRLTTEKYGIPSILLMENAAHAVARVITEKLGGSVRGKTATVLCGPGNNGGDGAALARFLFSQWVDVDVYLFGAVDKARGDARSNFEIIRNLSKREPPFYPSFMLYEEARLNDQLIHSVRMSDFVIDALFGTGLSRPLGHDFQELFEQIRAQRNGSKDRPLFISIDIPSGLDSDSPLEIGPVIAADCTVTLTAPKPGNVIPPASNFGGELFVGDIGTPHEMVMDAPSQLLISTPITAKNWLNQNGFKSSSYKNKRGHAFIIAGSESYSGAAVLCGNAAMRSGVGLVTIATPKSSKESVASRVLPEVMVRGVAETTGGSIDEGAYDELNDLLGKANSVAIGSGIAQDESTKRFVQKVIENRRQATIVDADALNLLAPYDVTMKKPAREQGRDTQLPDRALANARASAFDAEDEPPLIFTPHEGEFMRLLGTTDKNVIKDRVAAVREFATKHNVILVLKGERVLIGEPGGKVVVNPTGNSGLGKAGNGDTLTGILAGFVAQAVQFKIDIFETVVAAVYIAGMAGDIAEKKYGKRVMAASDVRECLTEVFASLTV